MTTPDSAPTPEILRARMVSRWMGLIEEAYQSRDDILTSAGYTPRSLGLNFVADQIRAEVERLAQSAPTDDAMWDQTLQERDTYHDWADKLAEGIAAHLGVDIGEHTAGAGANNPWANALEAIQAVAQSAPLAQQAREYPAMTATQKSHPKLPRQAAWGVIWDTGFDPNDGHRQLACVSVGEPGTWAEGSKVRLFTEGQMRAYVDADRAAAQVDQPAGRVIPADGEVRG